MNIDVDISEIKKLEKKLKVFKDEWEHIQRQKASKWRLHFIVSIVVAVALSVLVAELWWAGIIVIGYFAGSLFSMLRINAKTTQEITEHQKQLKLVKLLRNFEASPYSK